MTKSMALAIIVFMSGFVGTSCFIAAQADTNTADAELGHRINEAFKRGNRVSLQLYQRFNSELDPHRGSRYRACLEIEDSPSFFVRVDENGDDLLEAVKKVTVDR